MQARTAAAADGWRRNFGAAMIATVLTVIVMLPVFGLKVERAGLDIFVDPHWQAVIVAAALVFVVQLLRPMIAGRLRVRVPLPALPTLAGRQRLAFFTLVALIAIGWPFFADRNAVDIATLAMIYVMLGLGLNIVVGFAGLLDLGYVGFYAVGAYSYAMLFHWAGWSFWEALPVAGAMAAFFGFILGFPVLRLRGDYLAIVTLGFGEIIRLLLINLTGWTGGPDGIAGIPKPTVLGLEMARRASGPEAVTFHQFFGLQYQTIHIIIAMYLIALLLAAGTLWFSNRLIRMPIGRAWEALREDEIACRSLGLNPTSIKLSAFTMGAMFAGFGGALFAARQGIVNPESFTFIESALILAIVVLGGMGSQWGVILAALVIVVVPELARGLASYRMLAFGIVMIVMMVWRPQGLLPVKRHKMELPGGP